MISGIVSAIRLVIRLVIGFGLGSLVAGILLSLGHAPAVLKTPLLLLGDLVGAGCGYLSWRAGAARTVSDAHGSAQFGDPEHAKSTLGGEGLIVGRAPRGWLMRYSAPAHLLTIAPTRSGKGVGAVIPNLLSADRSVLCVDPKGENTAISYRARTGFGPVYVLDPFGASGRPSAGFNPLAHLASHSPDVGEEAALIADALVHDPPEQVGEAHWNEEAKALLAGFILHAAASPYPTQQNLAHVRELLTSPPQRLEQELRAMQASDAAGGLVARAANRYLGKADREAAGVLSAAQRHTHFLDSPRMAALLSRSDFGFEALRSAHATVFLVLPPDRLATHARWLRLMIAHAIGALAKRRAHPDQPPILFLLDEFAALGRLEPVERAFGLMAGYGLQLWPILQDLHQLRGAYGQAAGTFLANAGVVQVFNVADIDTASWVSRTLGATTQAYYTSGSTVTHPPGQWRATTGTTSTLNLTKRDLLTPDEVMRLDRDTLLLLRPGEAPLWARKLRYFADPEFRGMFDPAAQAPAPATEALPLTGPQAT
jgi:type IV secretion system protein VirD4